ncbi:MAG: protein phosphatase 2C domain-containing protein [Isosphaeraceae bacterium]
MSFDELVGRFYELRPRNPVRVEFGGMTHSGLVRDSNEDHYLVVRRRRNRDILMTSMPVELLSEAEQTAYTLAVADGIGGHAFGEIASFLALRTGWDLGQDEVKWPLKVNEREVKELRRKARVFFRLIDRTLHAAAAQRPRLTGMGTTLTIGYTVGPELFVMHAGDSRLYLYRDGLLTQLTHDHTIGQALVDAGLAAPGSAEAKRRRHALTNCLGGPNLSVEVDVGHFTLRDGDRLVLCTDGLTDLVDDPKIAEILAKTPGSQDAARALLDLALENGGKDNVTVVVARYEFPTEPESDLPG